MEVIHRGQYIKRKLFTMSQSINTLEERKLFSVVNKYAPSSSLHVFNNPYNFLINKFDIHLPPCFLGKRRLN